MATRQPEHRGSTDTDEALTLPDELQEPTSVAASQDGQQTGLDESAPTLASEHEVEEARSHGSHYDEEQAKTAESAPHVMPEHEPEVQHFRSGSPGGPLDKQDVEASLTQQSSAPERSSPPAEQAAALPTGSEGFNSPTKDDRAASSGFTFSRLDRRGLGMGGKRKESQHITPYGTDLSLSPGPEEISQGATGSTPARSSPTLVVPGAAAAPSGSSATAAYGSEVVSSGDKMSPKLRSRSMSSQIDYFQYQVDEQILQEASMSDGFQRELSAEAQSDDVVYIGGQPARSQTNPRSRSSQETSSDQVMQSAVSPTKPSKRPAFTGPSRAAAANPVIPHPLEPVSNRRSNSTVLRQEPTFQMPARSRAHTAAPVSLQDDTQDLLDVVAYKFREKEQNLQRAFSVNNRMVQSELQQAYEENEDLRSQVAAFEMQRTQSEAAVLKYRSQIGKARGLQKFLDGLGNDLQSLKRSYDTEKSNFTARMQASEIEIERLGSSLAGKNEFEAMLTHSKTSLEKLLDARGFELQSVIQHRDMLRSELDERIGQLVEERDSRLRLEQLVSELRLNERASLTASLKQVTTSLASRMSGLCQQDDALAIAISGMHQTVQSFAEQPSVTPDDCKKIMAQVHELGLRIAQDLSIEATTNTTLFDLTSSMEGLLQHHTQVLRQGLDRLETASEQSARGEQANAALQAELHGAADRLARLETQLDATRQSEASANSALMQSTARISELEATAAREPTLGSGVATAQEVEIKVKKALAESQKRFSDNANTFIAQEKARYSNELKKVGSERRKAVEEAKSQREEAQQLRSELGKLRNVKTAKASETLQQLEEMHGRFHALESKYEEAQLEHGEKVLLESRLTTMLAELELAKSKITEDEEESLKLGQEIESLNGAVLRARAAEEHATSQLEETHTKNQASTEDLHRQLSQAEEKARYTEAGVVQMKSSAEKAISDDQEKHRKQREALQQRLNEVQSELQMRAEEEVDTRAFVERTVKHQQTAWQKSNADLESKASDYKSSLEDTSRRLHDVQGEHDTLQAQSTQLQDELRHLHQEEAERKACKVVNLGVIGDLRKQCDAAQTEITSLQTSKEQHERLQEEHEARENATGTIIDELRKDYDSSKDQIADLQASERQRKHDDTARDARENGLRKDMDALRNERDTAQAVLKTLHAKSSEASRLHSGVVQEDQWPTARLEHQHTSKTIVPPEVAEYSAPVKQRRKANRNTNTIVKPAAGRVPTDSQPLESDVASTQPYAVVPATLFHADNSSNEILSRPTQRHRRAPSTIPLSGLSPTFGSLDVDEMLDSVSTQAVHLKVPETQLASLTHTIPASNKAAFLPNDPNLSQTLAMSLDFSGEPRVTKGPGIADTVPSTMPFQASHSSDFRIYEDLQSSVHDRQHEEDSVRANFTFRKPFPLPNSASKRLSWTTSDKSLEGRVPQSRGTRRTPENNHGALSSQPKKTPEASRYPFGSSPEFMNPPSIKVKRRYSGPNTPGNNDQLSTRRSSTPIPDPRIVAKARGTKRASAEGSQQAEGPPSKKYAPPTAAAPVKNTRTDDSYIARSSQSVNNLPRIDNLNAGRNATKSQSSHMRTSGGSARTTRNQAKASKDSAYQARFSQELRHR